MDASPYSSRAASLLDLSRFELDDRFRRLDVPRRMGADNLEEARSELEAILPESEG